MPYSASNPPAVAKDLPKHALDIFIAAFNAAFKQYDGNEQKSFSVAWAAVKQKYEQDKEGKWHAKKESAISELWDSIKRIFAPLIEDDPAELADLQVILPTQVRSFVITRNAQGVPRWLMIAASAVVNKVGAIDSTVLFDNFIRHAGESSEYPVLDFLHEGERVRFGMADWLKRDGALYLASGGFDDTELARAAIDGLEKQPDYWGASIAYRVTQAPLILQAEGSIPVYTDGINNFISIVPKRLAANLFTATLVTEEVRRMNQATYDELVKLVGEERAKQFASQVDDANRMIEDTGMVTRAEPEPAQEQPAPEAQPAAQDVAPVAPVVEVRQEPPAEEKPDDTTALKDAIARLTERVTALEQTISTEVEESKRTQQRATDTLTDIASRLAGVEVSKERWDAWLNDAPEYIKADAPHIFRARDQQPAAMTMEQIAKQNTAKLNRGPHFSRQHDGPGKAQ